MLSKHPEVCKRLRQEILEHVGESRRPTFDDLKDMKYLRAVINETIRLYPAVYVMLAIHPTRNRTNHEMLSPFNVRTTSKEVVLPGKYGKEPFYLPAHCRSVYIELC